MAQVALYALLADATYVAAYGLYYRSMLANAAKPIALYRVAKI